MYCVGMRLEKRLSNTPGLIAVVAPAKSYVAARVNNQGGDSSKYKFYILCSMLSYFIV
jgi:hypothetical protein